MSRRLIVVLFMVLAVFFPASAQAEFGIQPGSLSISTVNSQGAPVTAAGAHPYSFNLSFKLNEDSNGLTEGGEMHEVIVDLPPGFVGNLQAIPTCSRQQFEGPTPRCPGQTQVGIARATSPGNGETVNPIYNVTPPPGVAAQLGFAVFNYVALQNASVRPENYGISVGLPNVPVEVSSVDVTVWGTPSDSSHDAERSCSEGEGTVIGCSVQFPHLPFLTMPTTCGPFETTVRVDSKQRPGEFVEATAPLRDGGGNPSPLVGCNAVPFTPSVSAVTTTQSSESPSGLTFGLKLPNQGLLNSEAITETEPEKTEITFPPGLSVNPSAASGLGACSSAQYAEAACPESSKIGTLFAKTPLLEEPIEGSVYVATPHDNPFDSLIALYIIARVPNRGILVKQAGVVHADPVSGQLTSVFDHLPPIPYSSFEVKLREGPRAPLITPQLCGRYETSIRLYPFSAPESPVQQNVPFTISGGAGGGRCATSESQLPAQPTLEAGATVPLAGAYSPFIFRLKRSDGEQRISAVTATLPTGLVARLAGVPYCSDAAIAIAASRTPEGGGALENASPSCPAASQIGIVNVAAGAGSQPYYAQGKAYLAGPYKGAPLSVEIITPAIAGPFDLGSVAVRTALYVNESTAQVRAVADPLPTILHGISLDVRTISLQMDRREFTLNPTNCQLKSVAASVTTVTGATANLSNQFAVGGCSGLAFKPSLKLQLKGGTDRNQHPALKSVITYPQGESVGRYANIARASVTLPASEFIDQAHIGNPCIRPDFAAGKCPKLSVLGRAKAWSPLLDKPLEGKVYFRSNGGERELPDVVLDLNGQIHVVLVGFVDSKRERGSEVSRLRTTFAQAPDAPISKFILELKGGKEGLLVNSGNLCKVPDKAIVKLWAQNGKTYNTEPAVANGCKGGRKSKPKKTASRINGVGW